MDLKSLKWNLIRGPLMRRVVLRAFMLVLAVIVVSLMQMAHEVRVIERMSSNICNCPLNLELNLTGLMESASYFPIPLFGASPMSLKDSENLTKTVLKGLMGKNLLQSNAKSLCVGERSASAVLALRHLGFFDAYGVDMHPFFSLFKRRFVYELNFEDNHFDFVFSEDLDRLLVPALLVLEIERVLRPGGTGAILRLEGFASFERFHLPANCPSIANNQLFIKYIEPLGPLHHELSYLPEFLNISSRNKLVYINVGVGEYAKASIAKMSKPYCADHHAAFEVFIIDHKTSVLSSYVTDPGINFVYYPALAGDNTASDITDDEFYSAPMDDEGFDFVRWFKETVSDGDFVVLMMKAKPMELNILVELFKPERYAVWDELFLQCSDSADCKNLLKSLRKSGVYVHQWLGD
ncbi:hypothetical protein DH2020_000174 [Rehmannia glutinosa]|uniref:Methyltransferase type 11 domain-containing protein n=1 Tax=Rehmannia glutinosa TaxID=99300 RepID=A0ABR0XWD4_REHGL